MQKSFSKGFMIVAGFTYSGKLKIKLWKKNVKINSWCYQENVLRVIFTEEILFFYTNDFQRLKLHQDKTTIHTSKVLLHSLKNETGAGILHIPFQHIPVKSSEDSLVHYSAFGILKRDLSKRKPTTINGFSKVVKVEW